MVLLSGCATGRGSARQGIQRSLAQSFLEAGARTVIATRWPVEDEETHTFTRSLLRWWPFTDSNTTSVTVAMVSQHLRKAGSPARCWGAPSAY